MVVPKRHYVKSRRSSWTKIITGFVSKKNVSKKVYQWIEGVST